MNTLVSALPTPSARAASIALHTEGKIEPPVLSNWVKANSRSGYCSKWSASQLAERCIFTNARESGASGAFAAASTRGL